jgi:hypothetical protein
MMVFRRLEQLRQLSIFEFKVLLLAIFLLPILAMSIKFKGLKWTQATLSNHKLDINMSIPENEQLEIAQKIARMVSIAANHSFYSANCLKKSLLIWWLLSRKGIVIELKIGVNKDTSDFNAHAWVEYRGNVLMDTTDVGQQFSAFSSR